ncbi:MAG: hypothetical protein Q9227_007209 [Pyrenula ochraceoflavens]
MSRNTNTDIWLAGTFAAISVDLLVYPLDTLKTRIQSPSYTTIYKTTQGRVSPSLFRGLYQGLPSVILATIPAAGAFFTTYEGLKYALNELTPPNSTIFVPQAAVNSVASAGAELVSCAILTPAEVLKQNAQIVMKDARSKAGKSPTIEVLKQFRRQPKKLMSGYTALAARNLPFVGLQFPIFEHLKQYFIAKRGKRKEEAGLGNKVDGILERASITALSAGLAGSGAAWITTPIDVVKTRIMLKAGEDAGCGKGSSQNSVGISEGTKIQKPGGWGVFKSILKKEGFQAIFRGAILRSAWTAMGSGLYLGCYEGGRFWLEEQRQNDDAESDLKMAQSKDVKVGIGPSRSQGDKVRKSAWQD